MTIHRTHPFPSRDDPVRRFRGRLGGAVSLWTTGGPTGRAGLTVASLMVAHGDPAHVLGLIDPDSDLAEALAVADRAVVHLLQDPDRDLAEAFAGAVPAPGGPFRLRPWTDGEHGPFLRDRTRALVTVAEIRPVGWSHLVVARIDEVVLHDDGEPLGHRRGRYRTIA